MYRECAIGHLAHILDTILRPSESLEMTKTHREGNIRAHPISGFAVYSKHVSVGFSEDGLSNEERKLFETQVHKTGKGTAQIKFNQEVPVKIIMQTLKSHAIMNTGN